MNKTAKKTPRAKQADAARQEQARASISIPRPTLIAGLVILVIGILAVVYFGRTQSGRSDVNAAASGNTLNTNAAQEALMAEVIAGTRHFKGDANAPITVIEFGDFQ